MNLPTANQEETKSIFEQVDGIVPLDVNLRVLEGERIAQSRGLTLYAKKVRGPRVFNPWTRSVGNKGT